MLLTNAVAVLRLEIPPSPSSAILKPAIRS